MPSNTDLVIDTTPRGLADVLDGLVDALLMDDREVAHILTIARNDLRVLGANRYARALLRHSRSSRLRRRHQGRSLQEGQANA